jgi:nitroimidazol reductase NimA-like FMN-containing flavoprotein (pyridoxamine 5'-phosphate oxidase superfamily)
MCVLATAREGKPHCSLMAYVADEEVEWIYMVTHRNTTKYANLLSNEQVSLLVDNRCEGLPDDRSNIQALTVHGTFHVVEEEGAKKQILAQFRERPSPHARIPRQPGGRNHIGTGELLSLPRWDIRCPPHNPLRWVNPGYLVPPYCVTTERYPGWRSGYGSRTA